MADDSAEMESGLLGNGGSFTRFFRHTCPRTSVKIPSDYISQFDPLNTEAQVSHFFVFRLHDHVHRKCAVRYQTKH